MKATIKLEDGRTLDVEFNEEQLNYPTKADPMTWEKLVSNNYEALVLPNEYSESVVAERKLMQLRNWYRDGWKPDLKDDCWYVYKSNGGFHILRTEFSGHQVDLFSFQSEEVAQRFLNEQRELLEVWAKKFSA
jgi:hypothetical protein